MITSLRSQSKIVNIDTDGPAVVIGEKINPTGRKKLAAAFQAGSLDYVKELAARQIEAGADILDVNVGVPGLDDVALMIQVVQMLNANFNVPLCLDSANPKVLEAGLALVAGKALVNSVNGEQASLQAVLPLVKAHGAAVIGLTLDEQGVPPTSEARLAIAGRILERAAQMGIPAEDVVIDPLVLTVGSDSDAARVTLQTVEAIRREFGVNINIGASNVSFGLPDRDIINQAFLALAVGAGVSCAITDPMKFTAFLRAVDLLKGRDQYAGRFIKYYRTHPKEAA